jgi:hypothetical protein
VNDDVSMIEKRPMALGKTKSTKIMLSKEWERPENIQDIRRNLTRFDKFVPVIGRQKDLTTFTSMRQYMFNVGVYPGVEYRITQVYNESEAARLGVWDPAEPAPFKFAPQLPTTINPSEPLNDNINGLSSSKPPRWVAIENHHQETSPSRGSSSRKDESGAKSVVEDDEVYVSVRPIYPLIPALERDWPVTVPLSSIPKVLSSGMYNTLAVLSSLAIAASFLLTAVVVSQAVTLRYVVSNSDRLRQLIYKSLVYDVASLYQ